MSKSTGTRREDTLMNETLKELGRRGLLVAVLLLGAGARGEASDESLGLYEDWTPSRTIRSDRWVAVDTTTLEVEREVKGHHFLMRTRREGGAASDVGFTGARQRLRLPHPHVTHQLLDRPQQCGPP